jgi:hypothetical protein
MRWDPWLWSHSEGVSRGVGYAKNTFPCPHTRTGYPLVHAVKQDKYKHPLFDIWHTHTHCMDIQWMVLQIQYIITSILGGCILSALLGCPWPAYSIFEKGHGEWGCHRLIERMEGPSFLHLLRGNQTREIRQWLNHYSLRLGRHNGGTWLRGDERRGDK